MELLNAVTSSCKCKMDKASFEMNMILNNPATTDALEQFEKSLSDFTFAKAEMQTIELIQQQVEGFNQQNEAKTNSTNSTDG